MPLAKEDVEYINQLTQVLGQENAGGESTPEPDISRPVEKHPFLRSLQQNSAILLRNWESIPKNGAIVLAVLGVGLELASQQLGFNYGLSVPEFEEAATKLFHGAGYLGLIYGTAKIALVSFSTLHQYWQGDRYL